MVPEEFKEEAKRSMSNVKSSFQNERGEKNEIGQSG